MQSILNELSAHALTYAGISAALGFLWGVVVGHFLGRLGD